MKDFFEIHAKIIPYNPPEVITSRAEDSKIFKEIFRGDSLTKDNKDNTGVSHYKLDMMKITGDSKNTLTMYQRFFSLVFQMKLSYLGYGTRYTDRSCEKPFITTTYLGTLEDKQEIRIELNNCGITIGTGQTMSLAFHQRYFIGSYQNTAYDIFTLAKDLKWKLPKDFRDIIVFV